MNIIEKLIDNPNVCPFCNKEIKYRENSYLRYCFNHLNINVSFSYKSRNQTKIDWVILQKGYLSIIIFHNYVTNIMKDGSIFYVPIDNNLTPENFEDKIKTYLVFQ